MITCPECRSAITHKLLPADHQSLAGVSVGGMCHGFWPTDIAILSLNQYTLFVYSWKHKETFCSNNK